MADQIATVSKLRFSTRMGVLSESDLRLVGGATQKGRTGGFDRPGRAREAQSTISRIVPVPVVSIEERKL